MKKIIFISTFVVIVCQSLIGQSNDLKLSDFIDGSWTIDTRGSLVSDDKPDAGQNLDYNKEIIRDNDTLITFIKNKFEISQNRKGTFEINGTSLYLNEIKYKYGIFDKNKFSLVRFISPDLIITFMLERKK